MNLLSRRELQILARLAEGDSYKQMAQRFGISVQTVNDHIKNLYQKLQVHSRAHASVCYLNWVRSERQSLLVSRRDQRRGIASLHR